VWKSLIICFDFRARILSFLRFAEGGHYLAGLPRAANNIAHNPFSLPRTSTFNSSTDTNDTSILRQNGY
jgi:hypothetical protein